MGSSTMTGKAESHRGLRPHTTMEHASEYQNSARWQIDFGTIVLVSPLKLKDWASVSTCWKPCPMRDWKWGTRWDGLKSALETTFVREYTVSINLPNSLVRVPSFSFRWGNWSSERLRDLSRVKQLLWIRADFKPKSIGSKLLTVTCVYTTFSSQERRRKPC